MKNLQKIFEKSVGGKFVKLLHCVGVSGFPWESVGVSESLWDYLEVPRSPQESLGVYGSLWESLILLRSPWESLEFPWSPR